MPEGEASVSRETASFKLKAIIITSSQLVGSDWLTALEGLLIATGKEIRTFFSLTCQKGSSQLPALTRIEAAQQSCIAHPEGPQAQVPSIL
jgi:hypothetical protein